MQDNGCRMLCTLNRSKCVCGCETHFDAFRAHGTCLAAKRFVGRTTSPLEELTALPQNPTYLLAGREGPLRRGKKARGKDMEEMEKERTKGAEGSGVNTPLKNSGYSFEK